MVIFHSYVSLPEGTTWKVRVYFQPSLLRQLWLKTRWYCRWWKPWRFRSKRSWLALQPNASSRIQVYAVVHLWPESQVLIGVTSLWTPKKQHVETSSGSFPKSACGLAQGISLHYFLDIMIWYDTFGTFSCLLCWLADEILDERTVESCTLPGATSCETVFRWCSLPTSIQVLS